MIVHVRDADADDAGACAQVYAPYVRDTAISFEVTAPSPLQMAQRIEDAQRRHAWLVAQDEQGVLLGYAYAHPYATRPAYRWTCEPSVYLASDVRSRGVGRTLYTALLDRLVERGFRQAVAGVTLPNPASLRLHEAMGFEPVGVFRAVGWKHGQWHDVARLQRTLLVAADPPQEIV
ncbi:GNAT family N-acetyltransferase [Allobranchiibius sp. GilTou73]|uniref:GNAT family N-acetyltransferase n=1 Tax=Allobranchiibius sp. GilTou73 TaxID=2904523 RepID=UPI001F28F642|nr:GNAT family N-acetyltransferase [Allobranchiibius sp. GilTou73]UIJ34010.1 N-acetyltransferase family protein [Allobranchiibius sp. GilTou73]